MSGLTLNAFNTAQTPSGPTAVTITVPANHAVGVITIMDGAFGLGYFRGAVTDTGGNIYTPAGGANLLSTRYTDAFYCLNTGSSATSVTYTPSASYTPGTNIFIVFTAVWVWNISGGVAVLGSYSGNGQTTSGTGTDAVTSGSVTCASGSVIMGWSRDEGTGPLTIGTGFTSDFNSFGTCAEHGAFSASQAATWTTAVGTDTIVSQGMSFGFSAGPNPTIVQAAFNNGGSWPTSTSVTINGVTAGNAILIVTPAVNNTSGSPSLVVTDSVNTVTELEQIASFGLSSVFALLDFSIIRSASAGTHVLTATIGSGTGFGCIEAIEIAGLNSSAAVDVFALNAAGGGGNPTTGNTGTPASINEIAVAAVSGYENGTALTIGSPAGYTNIVKFESGSGFVQCSVDYLTPVALTAQSATWTGMTAVNSYAAGVIVLKVAANQATVMWWT